MNDKRGGATVYVISSERYRHCGVNELVQHSKRCQCYSNRLPADRQFRALTTGQFYNRPPYALLFYFLIGVRCIKYRPGDVYFMIVFLILVIPPSFELMD